MINQNETVLTILHNSMKLPAVFGSYIDVPALLALPKPP